MASGSGNQGNAETLRAYWAEGAGAAKIGWGTGGDFERCVGHLDKYMPGRAEGFCNLLHHRALGYYPATHAKMAAAHGGDLIKASVALGLVAPDRLALGVWDSMLHPRAPAGAAGGGRFSSKGGGAKKAGGSKGKKGAGAKGGKGAKQSASAAQAAQAKLVYDNFLKQNPAQRSVFLSKLSNPQLSALYKVANAGNSNDPTTKSALIAIKDQMAARSLTGTKGPTQIAQAKAAAAAKSAASKQASAAKKASTAQASAAKKTASAQASAAKKQASANAAAAKQAATNQTATQKAQAAMQATTQKSKVTGLTAALKSTTDPKQQAQILGMLKTTLGLSQSAGVTDVLALTFNTALHPHAPAGSPAGGQFSAGAPRNAQAAQAQKAPGAKQAYDKALAAKDAKGQLAGMTNEQLIALSKSTYSFKSSDPKVVQLRVAIANEIAKRGGNVNDYGGLGKSAPGGPKPLKAPAATKVVKAPVKAAAKPVVKSPAKVPVKAPVKPATSTKPGATATKAQAAAAVTAAKTRHATLNSSHSTDGALAMSMPMVSSQDGPMVTVNEALKTPHDIRRAVAAHGQVPPHMRPAYRRTVRKAAARIGAIGHVPQDWD